MKIQETGTTSSQSSPDPTAQAAFAETVLGRDFITPDEVSSHFGWSYTPPQIDVLYGVLVDHEILLWLAANKCALMPLPPMTMDIRDVMHLVSPAADGEALPLAEPVALIPGGWLAMRYGDTSLLYSEASPPERMLNVAEVVYGMTLYQKLRGKNLLETSCVMTSTMLRSGCRAHLTYPGGERFVVAGIWADDRYDYQSGFIL